MSQKKFNYFDLTRIVKNYDDYQQINQLTTYNSAAEYISKLTNKSTFWSTYDTFLNEVQIPFEFFCLKILKHIETKFIHIPLVKEIVENQFSLLFTLSSSDGKLNSIEGKFINFINIYGLEYTLNFEIQLECNCLNYIFRIYNSKSTDNLFKIIENCNKLDTNLIRLLEKKFLLSKNDNINKYFKVYSYSLNEYIYIDSCSDILNIPDINIITFGQYETDRFNKDIEIMFFQGFENFLLLSLLATQENPIDEIDYILNYEQEQTKKQYAMMQLIEDTNLEENELNQYIKTLKRKKHIIFQGSPGTGKTYLAKHIAKYLSSEKDGFYELIQFHPSYSYEDFIQGIRPQTSPDGNLEYSMIPGRFLTFCEKAKDCEGMCILIIDEINRANLSQVFGELMYLLEYREEEIQLAGSDQKFKIPENVYIIGTMNTADRSIALVDHALRRRFAFIPIKPNYDILKKYHQKHNESYDIESLINILKELNTTINDRHYEIGVSFFLTETLPDDLEDIWTMEIEPYLEEYFFDEIDKIDQFRWENI